MTQPDALSQYIHSQRSSGVSDQEIAQQLSLAGYSQEQISNAVYSAPSTNNKPAITNNSKRKVNLGKFMFPVVLLTIGLLAGTVFGNWLGNEFSQPEEVVVNQQEILEIAENDPVARCGQYYDVGYLKGLYGKAIDDQSETIIVPDPCEEFHTQGYDAGKQSASEQYASYDDSTRRQDLMLIAQSVYQFAIANNGNLPADITSLPKMIGKLEGYADIQAELAEFLDMSGDARDFPYDPDGGSLEATKYTIFTNQEGRLVLQANSSENPGQVIEIIR